MMEGFGGRCGVWFGRNKCVGFGGKMVQVLEGDELGGGERRWRKVVCRGQLPRAWLKGLGFRVWGLGFGVSDLEFAV